LSSSSNRRSSSTAQPGLILSDQAVVNPGKVPLDYIAKLAKPSTEDWYVYSPAIAAAKELALTRYAALEILLDLASSPDATDRLTTVIALAGISGVNPAIVWGLCARAPRTAYE